MIIEFVDPTIEVVATLEGEERHVFGGRFVEVFEVGDSEKAQLAKLSQTLHS